MNRHLRRQAEATARPSSLSSGVYLPPGKVDKINEAFSLLTTAFGAWQGILSRIDEIALHSKTIPNAQVNTRLAELKVKLTKLASDYKRALIEVNKTFPIGAGYLEYVDTWQEAYENGIETAIQENDCAALLALTGSFPINETFASYMSKKNADGRPKGKSPLKEWIIERWSKLESDNPTASASTIRDALLSTFARREVSPRGIPTGNWILMDGAGDIEQKALKDLTTVTARKRADTYRDNLFR